MRSGAVVGIDAVVVDVEVDMALGLPFTNVVGLAEGAAQESKQRVMAALRNCGYELPSKRTTINLAPADIRKDGTVFELPLCLGMLVAGQLLPPGVLDGYLFGGELSLDGAVKPIRGALPLALAARDHGFKGVMVPQMNAAEAALVDRVEVYPVTHLRDAIAHLLGEKPIAPYSRADEAARALAGHGAAVDMSEVRGQADVKERLEVAAAGGHNVLMCGPPGSGKTMLARRLPSIMPTMSFAEALEVTKLYSVLGLLGEQSLVKERPFRSPHHTISDAGLVGGGMLARPGELSMAHRGVLFLDELPEFRRNVLEVMRQPLEEGVVRLARANQNICYPASVMLVAAMNPCPCGYFGVEHRTCICSPTKVQDYRTRISGPMLDRIDITLETKPVDLRSLVDAERSELPSSHYRARVEAARDRQRRRFKDTPEVFCNAQMGPRLLRELCKLKPGGRHELERAVEKHGLTARAHDRILKLALTKADLEDHSVIHDDDVDFAIGCRRLDRREHLGKGVHHYVDPNQRKITDPVLNRK
ncbi:MAG: YifB family Mg chelatase-like AAA ATPase [Myxococcaceae bacterium]